MPQVMDPQSGQIRFPAQSVPDLVDRDEGFAAARDEHVFIFTLRTEIIQDAKSLVIEGDASHGSGLAELRWHDPVTTFNVEMLPSCVQGLVESCPGREQEQAHRADHPVPVRCQHPHQALQLLVGHDVIYLIVLPDQGHAGQLVGIDDPPLACQLHGVPQDADRVVASGCRVALVAERCQVLLDGVQRDFVKENAPEF